MTGLPKTFFKFCTGGLRVRGTQRCPAPTGTPPTPPTSTLRTLSLSPGAILEGSVAGTVVGAIRGTTTGSVLSLSDDAGGRFALSEGNIVAGSVPTNYEADTSHDITIVETLAGATGSPKSTTIAIAVSNAFEQPSLGTLTFSATTFLAPAASAGTIGGATAGSTITASGLPTGLTINGPLRTWAWVGGSAGTGSFTLTETLADSANSPNPTVISYIISAAPGTLQVLTLSASAVAENSAAGTVVGIVQNVTAGSALSLSDSAGSKFAISGGNIVAGSVPTNYENASTHNITIVETLLGATGNPKSTTVAISVTNIFEQPNLSTLSLSSTTFLTGATASGTINGATTGSSIAASGLPTGLSINGPARTWAWDGTGSVGSGTITLTETLADSSNSPLPTAINYTIAVLAQPTLSNFSSLGAAPLVLQWSTTDYVVGLRGQLQIATDSGFASITQNRVFFIDGASWALADESVGLVTPSGTYFARIRVVRDNESGATSITDQLGNTFNADVSAWSTTFTDAITISVAVWSSATGTDKSTYITASGGNLTLTMNNSVNAHCGCRASLAVTGKRYFETTIISHGTETNGSIAIGVTDSTTALGATVFPVPGASGGGGGCIFRLKSGSTINTVSRNGSSVTGTSLSTAHADGDKFGISIDTTANTIKLSHRPVSTGTWYDVQTITLTSQIPANWRAYNGGFGRTGASAPYDAFSTNFGGASFSRTLDPGYLMYG